MTNPITRSVTTLALFLSVVCHAQTTTAARRQRDSSL